METGNLYSTNKLGILYKTRNGVSFDLKEAHYFKKAADNGVSYSNYGTMLKNGEGIQKDKKEAARYYKIAVQKGIPLGMDKIYTIFSLI